MSTDNRIWPVSMGSLPVFFADISRTTKRCPSFAFIMPAPSSFGTKAIALCTFTIYRGAVIMAMEGPSSAFAGEDSCLFVSSTAFVDSSCLGEMDSVSFSLPQPNKRRIQQERRKEDLTFVNIISNTFYK